MVYRVKSFSLYSDYRWNGFSNNEWLGKQYLFAIMYIHSFFYKSNFMRTKPLILLKKRAKLGTKSGMLSIRAKRIGLAFAILNIIEAKHQNRAWLSLILYCMQTSLLTILPHLILKISITKDMFFFLTFYCIILRFLVS